MATSKQIRKWRREAREKRRRSSLLTKLYGKKNKVKIDVLDLNPHFTRGSRIPKAALTSAHKKIWTIGHANTRRREVSIDFRVPKHIQRKVILHEVEHIKNPRATEAKIQRITKKRYGFIGFTKKSFGRKLR